MESFYSTLKTEALHRETHSTRAQARAAVFDYIETFYNPTRLHSALGYLGLTHQTVEEAERRERR